jgi:hypothetical protein
MKESLQHITDIACLKDRGFDESTQLLDIAIHRRDGELACQCQGLRGA